MNPGFGGIHPEPIARYLSALGAEIQSYHADLGLATDGDADRLGAMLNDDVLIGGEESGGISIKGHIWLLIRPSGTEPVLRVYAEARDETMVKSLLTYGQQVARG